MSNRKHLMLSFSIGTIGHFGGRITEEDAAVQGIARCQNLQCPANLVDADTYAVVGRFSPIGDGRYAYTPEPTP